MLFSVIEYPYSFIKYIFLKYHFIIFVSSIILFKGVFSPALEGNFHVIKYFYI